MSLGFVLAAVSSVSALPTSSSHISTGYEHSVYERSGTHSHPLSRRDDKVSFSSSTTTSNGSNKANNSGNIINSGKTTTNDSTTTNNADLSNNTQTINGQGNMPATPAAGGQTTIVSNACSVVATRRDFAERSWDEFEAFTTLTRRALELGVEIGLEPRDAQSDTAAQMQKANAEWQKDANAGLQEAANELQQAASSMAPPAAPPAPAPSPPASPAPKKDAKKPAPKDKKKGDKKAGDKKKDVKKKTDKKKDNKKAKASPNCKCNCKKGAVLAARSEPLDPTAVLLIARLTQDCSLVQEPATGRLAHVGDCSASTIHGRNVEAVLQPALLV